MSAEGQEPGAPDVRPEGFVHLRVRSAYSLLEGAIKADKIGALAKSGDMPAVALVDRANLFGALEFSVATKETGVQPIIGCALPVSGIGEGQPERWARTPTVVLLAQNEQGYLNLAELSSIGYVECDGISEPNVPWTKVAELSEGLILLSGGPDGPVDPLMAAGKVKEGRAALEEMHRVFGDRLYVELQRHGAPNEAAAEGELVAWAYDCDVPLVATNDVYFAKTTMYGAHDALLCIADGSFVGQDERRRVTAEHWFKPAAEMRKLFADLPEACDNTLDIARRCAFMVAKRAPLLPSFPTGDGRSEAEELAHQAREGLKMRMSLGQANAYPAADYEARLEREIGIIIQMGFPGYFLIVSDFIKWAKAHDIPVGPGRGSGAGSLVAYALTITNLDPLRYGLLFERFLNPERVSMPDFDIDFCQERRQEVIDYVQQYYGRDRVAQIITFGTLQARAVLRDVGRVMQMPLGQVDRLAKMVPANPANPVTLAQAIDVEPRLKQARDEDEAVARLLDVSLQLEGLYRNASTHAAGVVIGDRPLIQLTPLYRDPRSDLPATQFNMKWVESAGLVKFDFLGLKTLTVIDRALKHLQKRGAGVDMDTLPLDDAKTYELMGAAQTVGVFQFEGQGMRDTLRQLRPNCIEDVTAIGALYRPGPMDNIPAFIDCKFGRKPIDTLHPTLAPVLNETYGIIVYQEQVMQIAQILAGYSLGEADLLRRAMGKKKKEEMEQQRARFVSGAELNGIKPDHSGAIFDLVDKFAGYGFNKSHAAAYAVVSYQTAWLKANAPVEFFAASMSLDIANTDKLSVFYQDAKRFGIKILPPDVNRSAADFEVENGEVLYALGAIRNVGLQAMEHVVQVRREGGPFRDIFDFVERVDPRQVNKRTFETLARAGAFDAIHPNRAQLVEAADLLVSFSQSVAAERASAQGGLFGDSNSDLVEAQKRKMPKVDPWAPTDRLDQELAAVGFYLSGHPLEDMVEALRRKRTDLYADALVKAVGGAEVLKMAGIVRRKLEKPGRTGEKFAFVTLSDPTGEYEVLFPPETLRRCRDHLEPGKAVSIKVRAKATEGEVRFFGDDAQPVEKAIENAVAGLRVHVAPRSAEIDALQKRLAGVVSDRGGEILLVAGLEQGAEVELKLPGRFKLDGAVRGMLKTTQGVLLVEDL
ncbi:DNA polymerase III subunit alpha [Phenylobacterium sp. LjRoot219]|uniref:DNA polymerase III subunit alpha n=1 Tax=Phenylobacterium sp. LjRoot219 TaxID=3342283 RepID=UPI003ECC6C98